MTDFRFPPDGDRGRAVDLAMRQSLADSLAYVGSAIAGVIDYDPALLANLVNGLQQGWRYPPSTFGLYCELVLALDEGDNNSATALLRELLQEQPQQQDWQILALENPAVAPQAARYLRLMDTDPDNTIAMLPPAPAVTAAFTARFMDAWRLLGAAIPELAAEISALVSQLILVQADTSAKYQFDGGSCYMLWGGLFLNAASHTSNVALVEVLAHESAHLLLYGFACKEPLVYNDDATLYPSPLRSDLRPMDGIFHATYVSARMHWAMSRLLASGFLDETARAQALQARRSDMENFLAGYAVVGRHGDLSATGAAAMAAASAYMESAKQEVPA